MVGLTKESIQRIVKEKESQLRCNCDLDKWQPEPTGHSWVCRIHKAAIEEWEKIKR